MKSWHEHGAVQNLWKRCQDRARELCIIQDILPKYAAYVHRVSFSSGRLMIHVEYGAPVLAFREDLETMRARLQEALGQEIVSMCIRYRS